MRELEMSEFFSERGDVVLDPIMRIDELFRADEALDKINLVVGVFRNEDGKTPVLECVKTAEARLVADEMSKAYLPIAGDPAFLRHAEEVVFGKQRLTGKEIGSIQTPGSTAALRLAAELIKQQVPTATVWISSPAYSNHKPIFRAAGLPTADYRYYEVRTGRLLFDEMLDDLSSARPGDVVLLHACCHNPTGADPSLEQWRILARMVTERGLLPLIDAAYLGMANEIDHDAAALRTFTSLCPDSLVAASFSKNFALYSERAGLLTVVGASRRGVDAAVAHAKVYARALYTSPPSHGARVIARILEDDKLAAQWQEELRGMRDKLLGVRMLLADGLEAHGVSGELFPSLKRNRGMFTLSRIGPDEIARLRHQYHVYLLDNGRVSFGGMRTRDVPRLCAAISEVMRGRAAA
jgi:aspartate/tyrosine/aromatic aminotransferase